MTMHADNFGEAGTLALDNIGSWPGWACAGATLMAALLILGSGGYFILLPQQYRLADARQQQRQLEQVLASARDAAAARGQRQRHLDSLRDQLAQQRQQLVSPDDVTDLLQHIANLQQASGLTQRLFKPLTHVTKTAYVVAPYAVTATGTYQALAAFISYTSTLPHVVTVSALDIQPAGAANAGRLRIRMTINLHVARADAALESTPALAPVARTHTPPATPEPINIRQSPFAPAGTSLAATDSARPDPARPLEPLEAFPLDALHMVGRLQIGGHRYALIQAPDGIVYRAGLGDHAGEHRGEIIEIDAGRVELVELQDNSAGGHHRHPTTIGMLP